jgi:starch-binding outer membrane protein, SusD/RagB family
MNRYQLENDMADAFNVDKKYTTKELIFYINSNGVNTVSRYHQAQRPNEEGGWSDVTAEPRFFYTFPEGPRKDFTYWTVFVDKNNTRWEDSGTQQVYIGKFRDAGRGGRRNQTVQNGNGETAWPISRYAEILLIYAEASVKADGVVSAEALEAVNKIRRRAGGYNPSVYADLPSSISTGDFFEAVIAERSYELAFECHRWFDLLRLDRIWEVNKDVFPNMPRNYKYLPKPATEMDLLPNLTQNEYN